MRERQPSGRGRHPSLAAEGLIAMRKAAALDAHLDRALENLAFWGVCDCILWPADWVVVSGWPDPAAPWRGRYRTALGAGRIAASAGGLEPMWLEQAARIGLAQTDRPIAGDVGLLRRETRGCGPTLRGIVGGIYLGGGEWASRTPGGVRTGRAKAIRAWRVPWRKRS